MKKKTMWAPLLAAAVLFMGVNPMTAIASGETDAGESAEEAEFTVSESALTGILESDVDEADADETDSGVIYDLPEENDDNSGDFGTDDI